MQLLVAPAAQPRALADAAFALKRLTAADRRSRAAFVAAAGPDALERLLDSQQHQQMAAVPCYPSAAQPFDAAAASRAGPSGSRPGSAGLPPRSPMGRPPRSPLGSAAGAASDAFQPRGAASEAGSSSGGGTGSQACTPERLRPGGTPQRWSPGAWRGAAEGSSGGSGGGGGGEYGQQMQYSAARILRHLALDGNAAHKEAARSCLPALVQALQGAKPRVAFALAAAISAAVEGSADAAQLVADSGGIQLLVRIMKRGSGHGKKAAAEALQVLLLLWI